MFTEPKIEDRAEQHYAGIRTQVTMDELGSGIIPQLHSEVMAWLNQHGVPPVGAPILRYHVIDMAGKLDIEVGWPITAPLPENGRVNAGVLPAGRYASLIYTGVANGIAGNAALIRWAEEQGIVWDRWDTPEGDAFRARVETEHTDPADEPDMSKWETEVAIKLAEVQE
ncbi:MAG TPA: GyrI-like domain-containing protein [Roseiflexaceae bacterium]|nr:GyrI-like domain-containing protein [Roseiflexaceae bacterium]